MAVTLNLQEHADIRERLFYAFAEARCPILMMTSSRVSLEDVFMELTADDKKARMEMEAAADQEEGTEKIAVPKRKMALEKKLRKKMLTIR